MACKPGSVPATGEPVAIDGHSSATPVTRRLVQPTRTAARKRAMCVSLFGLAPGGVYLAAAVTSRAVRSYRTLSPLPSKEGGLLSVALSLGSPPPDVIRHRASVEPGLSSILKKRTVAIRPSDALWHALALPNRQVEINRPRGVANEVVSQTVGFGDRFHYPSPSNTGRYRNW